ncbi:MAG: cyclopropane-fatty-acyl-phospholipid synthase family protein [Roseovarius sp.]
MAKTTKPQHPVQATSGLEADIKALSVTRPGDNNRRAYVGPPAQYDFMGATQFNLLTLLGLREEHRVIDIGCGSLRAGRYLIQYLMPECYTGIEPNTWLWKEAIKTEIGTDLIALKQPLFLEEDDFRMRGAAPGSADYIVAQSIYSHTGSALFQTSIEAAARCLAPSGQMLFTTIIPGDKGSQSMPKGTEYEGWLYPKCLSFEADDVMRACKMAGLHVQQLKWFHPRQTWFRATLDEGLQMSPEMIDKLGTGRPLFDNRFPDPNAE